MSGTFRRHYSLQVTALLECLSLALTRTCLTYGNPKKVALPHRAGEEAAAPLGYAPSAFIIPPCCASLFLLPLSGSPADPLPSPRPLPQGSGLSVPIKGAPTRRPQNSASSLTFITYSKWPSRSGLIPRSEPPSPDLPALSMLCGPPGPSDSAPGYASPPPGSLHSPV